MLRSETKFRASAGTCKECLRRTCEMDTHTITDEALGQPGKPSGGSEVRIVAFGYGVVSNERQKVFLPFVVKN